MTGSVVATVPAKQAGMTGELHAPIGTVGGVTATATAGKWADAPETPTDPEHPQATVLTGCAVAGSGEQ